MIRIDLGKGAGRKGTSEGTKTSFSLPGNVKIPAIKLDFKRGILVVIASAFAFLPHLFVNQYRAYLTSEHQLTLKTFGAESEKVKQDIARFQTFQKEMESYEEQKKKVRERLDVVKQLLTLRGTPVNVLDAIGQSLPQRVWLGNIDVTLSGQPMISLTGKSFSGEEISDFVDKLGESIYLGDVSLDGVTSQKEADISGDVKAFQIVAVPKGIPIAASRTPTAASNGGPGAPLAVAPVAVATPKPPGVGVKP